MTGPRLPQPYMAERWYTQLEGAIAEHPRGIAGVAEVLDLSRGAISMVVNGKYPASVGRISRRVLEHYDRHDCPHLAESITRAACRAHALRPAPTSSPRDMRHWRACQGCPHKPKE